MIEYNQFINGRFVKSTSTEVIKVVNPCTEDVLATIPKGSVKDANDALEAANIAQPKWKARTAIDRASYLLKMANIIRENRVTLANTLAKEQAKVIGLAQVEIDVTADYFEYKCRMGKKN